jgi:hypothetical protein
MLCMVFHVTMMTRMRMLTTFGLFSLCQVVMRSMMAMMRSMSMTSAVVMMKVMMMMRNNMTSTMRMGFLHFNSRFVVVAQLLVPQ